MIVDFFIDTNVIIGYIFSLDPLNKYSNKLIQQKHNLLYSEHVQQEYENKLKNKRKAYDKFFKFIQIKLNFYKNDLFDTKLFQDFINQFYKKNKYYDKNDLRKTINIFLKDFGLEYNCKINDLKESFNMFTNEFNSKIFKLEDKLNQHVNVIKNHDAKNYENLKKIISSKTNIHKEDEDILLDAEEYAKEHYKLKLFFITWDKQFFEGVKLILEVLCLYNICYIDNFKD